MIKAKGPTAQYLEFWAASDDSASDRCAAQMCQMSWGCAEAHSLPLCHLGCKLTAYSDIQVDLNDYPVQWSVITACKSDNANSINPAAGALALNQTVCTNQGTKSDCKLDAEIAGAY